MDGEAAYWKYDFEVPQYCWSKYLLITMRLYDENLKQKMFVHCPKRTPPFTLCNEFSEVYSVKLIQSLLKN
jgi:hypothetical protein